MDSDYKFFWTDEALINLGEILDYLKYRWTQREIANFKKKLKRQIGLIEKNPLMFPVTTYNKRLRKAVLSKQTTIFYELSGKVIYLAYIFNNLQNIERIR